METDGVNVARGSLVTVSSAEAALSVREMLWLLSVSDMEPEGVSDVVSVDARSVDGVLWKEAVMLGSSVRVTARVRVGVRLAVSRHWLAYRGRMVPRQSGPTPMVLH